MGRALTRWSVLWLCMRVRRGADYGYDGTSIAYGTAFWLISGNMGMEEAWLPGGHFEIPVRSRAEALSCHQSTSHSFLSPGTSERMSPT
jgi:hypothetical protein